MKIRTLLFIFTGACLLASCGEKGTLTVKVSNGSELNRANETVEIEWAKVAAKDTAITAENVTVTGEDGRQIPSQAVFAGSDSPQILIFQATVPAGKSAKFSVKKGEREEYAPQAYGRFVPERKDDYAWENNLAAFRIYGPALEDELVTNGIDIWSKTTRELVIDKWYAMNDYHTEKGEGNDAYKVGPTLGSGASVPFVNDTLWFSRNFSTWERLDNGPLRTTVRLTYAPFAAAGDTVSFVKIISLDANTRFNKITDIYSGAFDSIPVAAGIALHDGCRLFSGPGYIGVGEPASDSKTGMDGDIYSAVIMDGLKKGNSGGNFLAVGKAAHGRPWTYHMGAATSKADVFTDDIWIEQIRLAAEKLREPLKVSVR